MEASTGLVEAEGGRTVKSLGDDGTMSIFSSASAGGAAIQREMVEQSGEPKLGVRIGLHTGDVIEAQDDFLGTVANNAARSVALAEADEIRMSDATRIMVGSASGFQFSESMKAV